MCNVYVQRFYSVKEEKILKNNVFKGTNQEIQSSFSHHNIKRRIQSDLYTKELRCQMLIRLVHFTLGFLSRNAIEMVRWPVGRMRLAVIPLRAL